MSSIAAHKPTAAEEAETLSKTSLGFWIYIMTDCVLFASLFATFAVLRSNIADGPAAAEIFDLGYIKIETLLLLTSSFTVGLAVLAMRAKKQAALIGWLLVTFALGLAFLLMELFEFAKLYHEGHSWQVSGFLSSYFTLVGTHGLHILIGLLWLVVFLAHVLRVGLKPSSVKRLALFSLFWHFLDIVWIFIFTFVYLMGVITV